LKTACRANFHAPETVAIRRGRGDDRINAKKGKTMNNIIEYCCVSEHSDCDLLNHSVNALIQKGFQPVGGVSTTIDQAAVYFSQAMVKYAQPKKPAIPELPEPIMVE
jgi:hypothetical protein